jgi:hypothetical protein
MKAALFFEGLIRNAKVEALVVVPDAGGIAYINIYTRRIP